MHSILFMLQFENKTDKSPARIRFINFLLIVVVLLSAWVVVPAQAVQAAFDGIIKVRVSPPGQTSDIRVVPEGIYYILEAPDVMLSDTEYSVHVSGSDVQLLIGSTVLYSGPRLTLVRAEGNTEANFITFPDSPTQHVRTNYSGNMEFSVNSGLCAVNHVYVEDYVMGVIPYEMSPGWPAEALKAQAVCARNYGVKAALASPGGTWQLGDTASAQVYKGVPGVNAAGTLDRGTYDTIKNMVDATARTVMTYNGSVFYAFYSAWNGGETLNVKGWTGSTSADYGYTAVKADEYDDRRCQDSFWISRTISTTLTPSAENDLNIALQNMLVQKYKEQYGITDANVQFVSTSGINGVSPDLAPEVSVVFEDFSCDALFNTETEAKTVTFTAGDLKSALGISSSYCAFRIQNNGDGTTTLYNVRYGHGVGMSQRGAQQMAIESKNYIDILTFYYNGIGFDTLNVAPPVLPSRPVVVSPPAPNAVSAGYDRIRLTWSAVAGATGYQVVRSASSSGSYTTVYNQPANAAATFTDSGLTTGTPVYYKVRACFTSGGVTTYTAYSTPVSAKPVPAAPAISAAAAGYDSIKVTWAAVPGASGYEIVRSTASLGPYTKAGNAAAGATGFTNSGLDTNTAYYFKVSAYRIVGSQKVYGFYSAPVSAKPVLSVPALTAASAGYKYVKVSWTAVPGATGYEVWRSTTSSGGYTRILQAASGATGFTDSGLVTNTVYYYRVRAYRTIGTTKAYGDFSAVKSAKPVLSVPALTAASAGYKYVKVSWSAVSGASGYEVWRSTTSSGGYTRILQAASGTTGFTDSGLVTNTAYFYRVRAYRIIGTTKVYGDFSAVKSAKPFPAAPAGVKAVRASSSSVTVSWYAVAGASGYEVYRAASGSGTYALLKAINVTNYTNTGLTHGKTYYYKVRAYRTVGSIKAYGNFSAVVYAMP